MQKVEIGSTPEARLAGAGRKGSKSTLNVEEVSLPDASVIRPMRNPSSLTWAWIVSLSPGVLRITTRSPSRSAIS